MKQLEIKLPNNQRDTIDLSKISPEFEGVIIGLNNFQAIGFICYCCNTGEWIFTSCIDIDDARTLVDSLLTSLINELVSKNICTSFRAIKFE